MKAELEQQLIEKYPKIFQIDESRRLEPFPMFGIECRDGWYDLLNHLCGLIQNHIDWGNKQRNMLLISNPHNHEIPKEIPQVTVSQIKEKFGTLRFYYDGGDECIDGMVRMADAMSGSICEVCGNRGQFRGRGWYYTACDTHTKEEDLAAEKRENTHGSE